VADQLGVFSGSGSVTLDRDQAPAKIIVRIPDPGPTYDDGVRYPLDLVVTTTTTTTGVRLVRVPPPPPLTQADVDRMVDMMVAMLARCTMALTELKDFGQLQIMLDPPYRAS
jgi:hypothetical protein